MEADVHLSVVAHVRAACADRGLDLVQPLQVGWYNEAVDAALRLPDFGRSGNEAGARERQSICLTERNREVASSARRDEGAGWAPGTEEQRSDAPQIRDFATEGKPIGALCLVIGNTRALWPRLRAALAQDAALAADPDPVDRYCEEAVRAALAGVPHACEVRFAPELPPRRVAMQRLAHVAGLAYLSPSHLSVHPIHGPWIGLRAAVVVDLEGPPGPPPRLAPPCDCALHCAPRLRAALAQAQAGVPSAAQMESAWRAWLAVRDACPVGRAHRYGDEQIRYHYVKDRGCLAPKPEPRPEP